MEYFFNVMKNYAVFNGRTSRKEYWMFVLFSYIFSFAAIILDNVLGLANDYSYTGILSILYSLATLLPSLGAVIRRLHDTGKSG